MEKDKIEVGEYIRTKNGIIGKLENVNEFRPPESKYAVEINEELYFTGDDELKIKMAKHSKDIISLIETGDYVNGQRVQGVSNIRGWIDTREDIIYKDNIKSIVTKEQFKEMEYRV